MKMSNQYKWLEEEDVHFLDDVAKKKAQEYRLVQQKEQEELAKFKWVSRKDIGIVGLMLFRSKGSAKEWLRGAPCPADGLKLETADAKRCSKEDCKGSHEGSCQKEGRSEAESGVSR